MLLSAAGPLPKMSIINQIDIILVQIPQISGYSVKGLNYLLPFDTANDIKNIFPGLLNELKDILSEDMGIYDSNRLCHILEHKFKVYIQIDSCFMRINTIYLDLWV